MDEINKILSYLSGGWVSVALTIALAIIAIFLLVYKNKILKEKAERETEEEKKKVTDEEKEKSEKEDEVDDENRKATDEFLK